MFVGSAGAYKDKGIEPMHLEGDERKGSAGHVAVEKYLVEQARPSRLAGSLRRLLPACVSPCSPCDGCLGGRQACLSS